jgi:hypothetical protein
MKLTKSVLREMILEVLTEEDESKKEESITSKLKREFKEYDLYNKNVRKL